MWLSGQGIIFCQHVKYNTPFLSIRDIIYKFILNTWSGKMTLEERETQPKRCNRGNSKSINWKGARLEHWKVLVETYLLDKDAQLHMATEALESPSKIADDDRILLDTLLCQWVFLLKWFNLYTRILGSTRYFTITPQRMNKSKKLEEFDGLAPALCWVTWHQSRVLFW